jgi:hypothetical protein
MGLSTAASVVLVSGALATLVAGALWMRAWRGRVTGWATCCGKCGFELQGLNPGATLCPECGQSLARATLRPAASEAEPWRWGLALTVTSVGVVLLWLGQTTRLLNAGRAACAWLPNGALLLAFESVPRAALPEMDARISDGRLQGSQLIETARIAAAMAAANQQNRIGEGARLLNRLSEPGRMDAKLTAEVLATCLQGVDPVAGQPKPARTGSLFIATARLPILQGTQWISRPVLTLTIEGASLKMPDGSEMDLAPVSDAERRSRREFDGAAFRAPTQVGQYTGTLRVRMEQPGGGFKAIGAAPFLLKVVDPTQITVESRPDAELAKALEAWARMASASCDASGKLVVSLPGDITPLQASATCVAARVLVEQDGLQLEVGRVWIDETSPGIELTAVGMPDALDRQRPATLRFEPDAAFALSKAASDCVVMRDPVSVPLALPAPSPPAAAPSPAPAHPPA